MDVRSLQNSSSEPISIGSMGPVEPIDIETETIDHEIPDDIENLLPSSTGDIELDEDTYTERFSPKNPPIDTLRDSPDEASNTNGPHTEAFPENPSNTKFR
jgi:hypothetical protein